MIMVLDGVNQIQNRTEIIMGKNQIQNITEINDHGFRRRKRDPK